jgi:DNA polymerase-3 subunit gamma/tau
VAIDQGRFVDLIEVDAASRTRVEDTRDLLDNVQYMPTRGRFKIYLIDEVHMLSMHSFNALLKTLEEPPPHVKFLLATTDPQKLPVTVLSRCLQFNLKKLSPGLILEQLTRITGAESIGSEPAGLKAIARAADGSMRDALSLLDQAIAFGGGQIVGDEVAQMLGSIKRDQIVGIVRALAANDGAALLSHAQALDDQGADFATVLDELMGAMQRIAVAQLAGEHAAGEEDAEWRELAERISPEDVQLYYQIALAGRRDISICRDERMSFEMSLLRMLAFRLEDSQPALPVASSRTAPKASPRPLRQQPARDAAATDADRPRQAQQAEPAAGGRRAAPAPPAAVAEPIADWHKLVRAAGLRGAVRNLADHCELGSSEGNRLELVLMRDKSNFNTDQLRQRLEQALAEHLGRPLALRISPGDPPRATPAEIRRANEDAQMRKTRQAIEQDPTLRAVQSAFDAVLEPDSIRPAQPKG